MGGAKYTLSHWCASPLPPVDGSSARARDAREGAGCRCWSCGSIASPLPRLLLLPPSSRPATQATEPLRTHIPAGQPCGGCGMAFTRGAAEPRGGRFPPQGAPKLTPWSADGAEAPNACKSRCECMQAEDPNACKSRCGALSTAASSVRHKGTCVLCERCGARWGGAGCQGWGCLCCCSARDRWSSSCSAREAERSDVAAPPAPRRALDESASASSVARFARTDAACLASGSCSACNRWRSRSVVARSASSPTQSTPPVPVLGGTTAPLSEPVMPGVAAARCAGFCESPRGCERPTGCERPSGSSTSASTYACSSSRPSARRPSTRSKERSGRSWRKLVAFSAK